jgi:glucosyl-dolichyl phosphate glucuronosyltransferase
MRATVIVPTFGRPAAIKGALRSLLAVGPRKLDTEILVVDNNSDPNLSADLRTECGKAGEPVRYAAEPGLGQTAARHRGAKEARGDLLIYVDDDVEVSSSWLGAFLEAFEDPELSLAGGPSLPTFTGSVPPWLWDFLQPTPFGGWSCGWLSLLDIGKTVREIDPVWIWGLNFAIRKSALLQLGGFHPDLVPAPVQRWQGDGETGLGLRAKSSRVRCSYLQEALLHHVVGADRLTAEYFSKRAYYQGVCDSFTRIRAGTDPAADSPGPRPIPAIPSEGATPWARAAYPVRLTTAASYNEGWRFHQKEAAGDPRLLQWIRRHDFWNADIHEEIRKPPNP